MSIFTGKTLMITGGTGSFGNAVLNRFLKTDIAEIRIFLIQILRRYVYFHGMKRNRMICVMNIR
jgi:UDP-glucose 4-epimerase